MMHSYFTLDHILEIPAVVFGILNVYLAARENIWNFLFGFFMCAIYFVLDWSVHIYADMTLQIIFILFQFYGFYQWRYGSKHHSERQISYAPLRMRLAAFMAVLIIGAAYTYVLKNYTDSSLIPLDVTATAFSIVAQWMMSKKWVENWWLWIVIDVDSIALYGLKHLYFTAGLYLLLLIIAVMGTVTWQRRAKKVKVVYA